MAVAAPEAAAPRRRHTGRHDPQLIGPTRLDRVVEAVLMTGLLASAACLLGGLLARSERALWTGTLVLLLTPMARVAVVTVGLLRRRDWVFAAVSLWILGVLVFSCYMAGLGR